jgi:hypothetical protein
MCIERRDEKLKTSARHGTRGRYRTVHKAVFVLLFSKQVSQIEIRSEVRVKRVKLEPERNHEHTVIIFGDP